MRRLILAVFVIFVALACLAESPSAVSGVVLDPSGAAIAGAQVSLTNSAGQVVASGITDDSGSFHLAAPPSGKYTISASHPGFRNSQVSVVIGNKAVPALRLVLPIATTNRNG